MKSRSQHYQVPVGSRRYVQLTVRRFRVAKQRRTTQHRQLVLDIRWFGLKQLVIEFITKRPVGRPKKAGLKPAFWQLQVSLPMILIVAGLAGAIFMSSQLVITKSLQPVKAFAVPATSRSAIPKTKTLPASEPTHISIPSVNIDANVIAVGLAADGSINLPPTTSWQVGWYSGSPTPGQLGPAVLAGHVDSTNNISVFWRLRYVKAGDTVSITRADGSSADFTITGLQQYDQHNFPTETVYQNLDYAGLKLITCGGEFDEQTHHYTENTVVTAKLE